MKGKMGGKDGTKAVCVCVFVCVCVSAVSLESPVALFTVTNTVKIRTQTPQVCV